MRHRHAGRALGRTGSHRKALIRNQITDLLRHDRIVTTEAKARELRPAAERVITLGKRGSLHARRQAAAVLTDRKILSRLFTDIASRYQDRNGGYTRIVKLGPRRGDGARMAQIELIESGGQSIMTAAETSVDAAVDDSSTDVQSEASDILPSDQSTNENEVDGVTETPSETDKNEREET